MKNIILFSLFFVLPMPCIAPAQGLRHILPELLNQHELVKAAEAKRDSALSELKKARGGWYPEVNLSSEAGQEDIRRTDHSNTSDLRNVQTIRGTQRITDFGRTSGSVNRAAESLELAKTALDQTRQQVLLEGITAFLGIVKAREQLKYAFQSEQNISTQTGMEETLVKRGAGLSSDVLQIKSQLAGARARRVMAKGALRSAANRFKAVFNRLPTQEEIDGFTLPINPFTKLPMTLDDASRDALKNNPDILIAKHTVRTSEEALEIQKAAYYPFLNLFVEGKRRENDEGASGIRTEGRAGIEFQYNLFKGGADSAAISSARSEVLRLKNMETNTSNLVEEQLANAWENLLTSRENHSYLENQAIIIEEFLNLARKERKLGTRSLLDVINGETNFINATSMAVAANMDIYLATYQLYYALGKLRMDLF